MKRRVYTDDEAVFEPNPKAHFSASAANVGKLKRELKDRRGLGKRKRGR